MLIRIKKEIKQACISKYNTECEKRAILLIISVGEKRYCVAVKKLPTLFCLNCFQSFQTKSKLQSREKVWKYVKTLKENDKVLKCTQDQTSIKIPFVIYGDTESLLEKNTCMRK